MDPSLFFFAFDTRSIMDDTKKEVIHHERNEQVSQERTLESGW